MNETVRGVFDTRELRRTFGQFATGVAVVTCRAADGAPVGMTANSFSSVSLDPPLVLWSVERAARSFEAFAAAGHFAFSVLALDQMALSNRFAQAGAAKFADVEWSEGIGGVPLIAGCAARFECRRYATYPGGDHLIVVGEVERFARSERRTLVFADGRYGAVAPHPGSVGEASAAAPAERHPYDDFLVPLLFRAYNHLFRGFSDTLVAEDATGAQMRILSVLSARGPTEPDALLTRTMLSRSSFEEAAERLTAAALMTADASGRAAITPAGEAKLADLLRLAADRERLGTAGLEASEVALLRTLLRKLVRHHEGEL